MCYWMSLISIITICITNITLWCTRPIIYATKKKETENKDTELSSKMRRKKDRKKIIMLHLILICLFFLSRDYKIDKTGLADGDADQN
jgi:hypothetical protein